MTIVMGWRNLYYCSEMGICVDEYRNIDEGLGNLEVARCIVKRCMCVCVACVVNE